MKKAKNMHWLLTLLLLAIGTVSINAQFDDLYFDEDEFETTAYQTDDLAYADYDDEVMGVDDAYAYDEDDYDEYLSYRENDYDVDAYRYTNRFNNFRYSNFYARSGYLYDPVFGASFIGDPWGYSRFARQGVSIGLTFGNPYVGALNPIGFNRFNRFNTFNRGGFGFGGFGVGRSAAYYCPPYNPSFRNINAITINNTVNNRAAGTSRSTVNRSRRTGSTTTSSRVTSSRRATTTKSSTRSTSRRSSSRATSPSRSSTRSTSRSSSRRATSTPSRSRSSFSPRSTTRSSSRSVSRSGSSRSSSPRSSSSSRRSPR